MYNIQCVGVHCKSGRRVGGFKHARWFLAATNDVRGSIGAESSAPQAALSTCHTRHVS